MMSGLRLKGGEEPAAERGPAGRTRRDNATARKGAVSEEEEKTACASINRVCCHKDRAFCCAKVGSAANRHCRRRRQCLTARNRARKAARCRWTATPPANPRAASFGPNAQGRPSPGPPGPRPTSLWYLRTTTSPTPSSAPRCGTSSPSSTRPSPSCTTRASPA